MSVGLTKLLTLEGFKNATEEKCEVLINEHVAPFE